MKWLRKNKQRRLSDYEKRVRYSASNFCGMRHNGSGPSMTIDEIRSLIIAELTRLENEAHQHERD